MMGVYMYKYQFSNRLKVKYQSNLSHLLWYSKGFYIYGRRQVRYQRLYYNKEKIEKYDKMELFPPKESKELLTKMVTKMVLCYNEQIKNR